MHGFLKGEIVAVAALQLTDRRAMFSLMDRYYDYMTWERFNIDLDEKDHVILLRAGEIGEIKGFSTLRKVDTEVNGRTVRAIFSGDTVVDEAYWGQRVLGRKFLGYLFLQKLKNPVAPLYWLLISKGYKTYLLMANNFREHYPRFEKPTPNNRQELIDVFATKLFGSSYSAQTGCCKFPQSLGQLRAGVAPLKENEVKGNPRIKYFLDNNPGWANGEELVCLARMSWSMPLYYLGKAWWKLVLSPWVDKGVKELRSSSNSKPAAESLEKPL